MFTSDEVYTVSRFVHFCKQSIEGNIPSCWVQGEVSNLSRPASGHIYFSLKDEKAQIRTLIFRLTQKNIVFELEDGLSILVRAKATIYENRGDFQIIAQQIENIGIGNLQRAFEQLKKRLAKAGFFDSKHKKSLPISPKKIGVITSASSAVVHDIIQILKRRHPSAHVLIFDTLTQGDLCVKQMIHALLCADKHSCDTLILARGGGSYEDLWCFNEETVVKTIFKINTPIVSAIGHESDVTIADFIADVRAPSPSAAAEIVSPNRDEQLQKLSAQHQYLYRLAHRHIREYEKYLAQLKARLIHPKILINQMMQRLDDLVMRLGQQARYQLSIYQMQLENKEQKLRHLSPRARIYRQIDKPHYLKQQLTAHTLAMISHYRQNISQCRQLLNHHIKNKYDNKKRHLVRLNSALEHLNPKKVLARGFSITLDENNKLLTNIDHIHIGDKIGVEFACGSFKAIVDDIDKN